MTDASTLIILAAASCIVAPALVCAFCGPVENNSRAIKNDARQLPNPSRGGNVRAVNHGE